MQENQCFNCHKIGHRAKDCRSKLNNDQTKFNGIKKTATTARAMIRKLVADCYVSVTHVNSISVSIYHVTICQQTLFRDAWQLTTILSSSLCSLRHSSEILWATLKSYLMSLLFSHHQWISIWTLYSTFQPSTLHFRVQACTEQSLLFITCLFHVSEIPCSYISSTCLS